MPIYLFLAEARYDAVQRLLAWLALVVCCWPAWQYTSRVKADGAASLPVLPAVCLSHVLYYSIPIFYESRLIGCHGSIGVSDGAVTWGLLCVLLGVLALQLGWAAAGRVKPPLQIRFPLRPGRGVTLALVVTVLGLAARLWGGRWVGTAGQQVLGLLFPATFPVALLTLYVESGRLSRRWRFPIYAIMAVTGMGGLAVGYVSAALTPLAAYVAALWYTRRAIPVRPLLCVVLLFVLAEPVKAQYRQQYWWGPQRYAGALDKAMGYCRLVIRRGRDLLSGGQNATRDLGMTRAASRISGILPLGQAIEWTPERVPYQHGRTYSYLVYSLVPRLLWAEKPIAQGANDWYAVAYELLPPSQIGQTMIGIRGLVEAYINFGVAGIVGIPFLMGCILRCVTISLGPASGEGGVALALGVVVALAGIEGNTAGLYGGLLQMLLLYKVLSLLLGSREERLVAGGNAPSRKRTSLPPSGAFIPWAR